MPLYRNHWRLLTPPFHARTIIQPWKKKHMSPHARGPANRLWSSAIRLQVFYLELSNHERCAVCDFCALFCIVLYSIAFCCLTDFLVWGFKLSELIFCHINLFFYCARRWAWRSFYCVVYLCPRDTFHRCRIFNLTLDNKSTTQISNCGQLFLRHATEPQILAGLLKDSIEAVFLWRYLF